MPDNVLVDISTKFAVQILKLTDSVKGHYSLFNQLERSGTSIGANIREAKYAHSRPDFIAKLQIALKECYETEYWLEIAREAELLSADKTKIFCTIAARYAKCLYQQSILQRNIQHNNHYKTIAGLQSSLFVCAFRATNGCKNSNAMLVAMRCFLFYNYLKTN